MNKTFPCYLETFQSGALKEKAAKAYALLERCEICPRSCRVNRLKNERGFCRTGKNPLIASHMPHHGEEPPISGTHGSGTIFFSGCNLHCVYCQNYHFSQEKEGREETIQTISEFMLELQKLGCHNINFVTPTHVMPSILKALLLAIEQGLRIPLVYNTSSYELVDMLNILDGVIDIYLADLRYADSQTSQAYSQAADYPQQSQEAVKEMHRQVGDAEFNPDGTMRKGLIIRHLVLPNGASGTEKIMRFISQEISPKTYISLMSQYFPFFQAPQHQAINRRISAQEYRDALHCLHTYKLENGWTQDPSGLDEFAGVNIVKKNARPHQNN